MPQKRLCTIISIVISCHPLPFKSITNQKYNQNPLKYWVESHSCNETMFRHEQLEQQGFTF